MYFRSISIGFVACLPSKEYDMATGEGHDHCSREVECFEKVFDGAFIMTMISMCMAAYLVWKRA